MQFTVWGEGGNEYIRCLLQGLGGDVRRSGAESRQASCADLPGGCGRSWMSFFRMWLGQRNPDMIFWPLWRGRCRCWRRWEQRKGWNIAPWHASPVILCIFAYFWCAYCIDLVCFMGLGIEASIHNTCHISSWPNRCLHTRLLLALCTAVNFDPVSCFWKSDMDMILGGIAFGKTAVNHCYGLEELQLRMVSYGVSPCVTNNNLWKTSTMIFSKSLTESKLKTRLIHQIRED